MSAEQFAVIGLGRFGYSVASTLSNMGNEVLAIDRLEEKVQNISENVIHAVQADATDEKQLEAVGVRNFDKAIVSIGEDIQSSIMVTVLVKDLGVEYVVVKAQNNLHGKVLERIGADRVVYPERDMGTRVAHQLISTNILDYIELSPDYSIAEITIPQGMIGKSLQKLDLQAKYDVNVLAIKKEEDINFSPSADEKLESKDVLIVLGEQEDIAKLENMD